PARARAMLQDSSVVRDAKRDPTLLAKILESMRGVKFEIVFKSKAWGRLMLEFGDDPAALVDVARPLVIETLRQQGAALEDIERWSVAHDGKTISLHGELSPSGLLRLGSLFELPSIELDKSEETVDAKNPMLYATQNHFKAVLKLLDDLLAQKRDAKT